MPKVFCVSYDLDDAKGDYSGLYQVLKDSKHWWHYLESTWLVVVEDSHENLWKKLEPHVGGKDGLLVMGVTSQSTGWLPKKAWEWIKRNVDSFEPAEQ